MNQSLQWKLLAGFLLVFIAGGTTGAFLGASHARRAFFDPNHGEIMGERIRERLRSQLDLTPEQMTKISPIINKTTDQLQQIRGETGRRVRDLIRNSHEEMAAYLDETQRAKLQKIEERHRRWQQHHRGFHRRPPPSPADSERERQPQGPM